MTFVSANLTAEEQIAAFPFLIETLDADVRTFLDGLPIPDFSITQHTDVLWATRARVQGGTTPGSAYVVSSETYKRLKAHRY